MHKKKLLAQNRFNVFRIFRIELTDLALSRKIELCNELLVIANVFEPGASLFRGKVLLDLQEAITVQTKRKFNNALITKESAQVILQDY